MPAPLLDGIHHVKLPVRDLEHSRDWYASRLGYVPAIEFIEHGELRGLSLRHPNGGPEIALRLDPERAARVTGFDYFAIGVPTRVEIEDVAVRLAGLGEAVAEPFLASVGWILPGLLDPDGFEIRFYTTESHRQPPTDGVLRIESP